MRFIRSGSRGIGLFKTSACLRSRALVVVLFLLLLPSHAPAAQEPAATQQGLAGTAHSESKTDKALNDARRLGGHWVVVKMRCTGSPEFKPASDVQFVFTEKEVKYTVPRGPIAALYLLSSDKTIGGRYRLDPEKTPRHIDVAGQFGTVVGIYRFEGERLWLCMAGGYGGLRPDSFDTKMNDLRVLVLLERGKPNVAGLPSYIHPGYRLADKALTAELRKRAAEAVALIEAKRYGEFCREFMEPCELEKKLKTSGKTLDDIANDVRHKAPLRALVLTLGTLQNKTPVVNVLGPEARFDLRDTHFDGAPLRPEMTFIKVDGKWRIGL